MKKISSFIIIIFLIASCSKSGGGGGGTTLNCSQVTNKAFAADVNPLIQSFCTQPACHGSGSGNGPGPLTSYNQIFNARGSIRPAVESGLMPQMVSLSSSQKNTILCWIDSGAPNN